MNLTIAPVREMRAWIDEMVDQRRHHGRTEAVHQVAREIGISARRVLAIMHGEVKDVWATEYLRARAWYARECERQSARYEHEAEICRIKARQLRERLD